MKNILILSNNCISENESNGRLHGNYFLEYKNQNLIHNFYIRGNVDINLVKYICKSPKKAYLISKASIYATDELQEYYSTQFVVNKRVVIHFSSLLNNKFFESTGENSDIFYSENLYSDRCKSIIEIANRIGFNEMICIFENVSEENAKLLSSISNIRCFGVVSYEELIQKYKNAKLPIHIEGFSLDYIKDCRFAFSKLGDYKVSGIPCFVYGSNKMSNILENI